MAANSDDVYRTLNAEDHEVAPMEVESMCVQCEENGITKLMCISIPYYKAVILMSFECPHCGYHNNEIQSGEAVQEHGTEIVLRVHEQPDLRRQVVKSEYATIEVPELELTIPAKSQPAEVTTVEGVIERVRSGLSQDQERRREQYPEQAAQIDAFLQKLDALISLEQKWTLRLHDPTGNCFIQNPDPRHVDPRCIVSHYHRPLEEKKLLGLADDDDEEAPELSEPAPEWHSKEEMQAEILHLPTDCPNCGHITQLNLKPTDIPYFQTVIIMALSCERCGYKTNEVKSGGPIREHGLRQSLTIKEPVDLARDVLKSDTCSLEIPEFDLEVGCGALSSRFTTVEGLLSATKDQIGQQSRFFTGDSANSEDTQSMESFLAKFDDALALKRPITVILDDPAGNSYVQSLTAPLDDPNLKKEFYTRTFEQNDELGLNDMKVDNYMALEEVTEENEEEEAAAANE